MSTTDAVYLLAGGSLLLAVVLPTALSRAAVSAPIVLLVVGALIGLLPLPEDVAFSPVVHRGFTEHLTEFTVLIALMGVGLALDRPLNLRQLASWRKWSAAWVSQSLTRPSDQFDSSSDGSGGDAWSLSSIERRRP